MRKLFYLLLFVSQLAWAELPLSFTETPAINDVPTGQVQVLNYTVRNNLKKQALPILSVNVVNDGDHQPATLAVPTTTCPATLAPQTSCSVSVLVNGTQGNVNRHLSIAYGGRAPLVSPIVFQTKQAAYTILIYIVGSDLESDSGEATFNINQMKSIGSTLNMNIVIETGGANSTGFRVVLRKYILKNGEYILANLGRMDMSLQSTIQDFFAWGVRNFPADNYIAIFWNHGGGPNFGYGGDEVHEKRATPINQLAAAMQYVTQQTGKHFEIIGFDTCFLGNVETYSGLHLYTNYLVGSEDLEPGKGWQYNTFLNYVTLNPTANGLAIGRIIANGFTQQNSGDSTTLSVVKANTVPSLITAIGQFSTALSPYVNSTVANWKLVAQLRARTPDYGTSAWDNESYDVADLTGLANSAAIVFPSDAALQTASANLIASVQNAVKYVKNSPNRAASFGITIYFPSLLARYVTNYPNVTLLNGTSFFTTLYTTLVNNYYNFYLAEINNLVALPSGLAFDGTNYTAVVSNDFEEIDALVGNDSCTNVVDDEGTPLGVVPCYTSLQSDNIVATPGAGTTWDISFNKAANIAGWPLINGTPILLLALDTEPVVPNEISYLIPVTKVRGLQNGYLSINAQLQVVGFQRNVTNARTQAKIGPITNGDRFFIRTYALNGSTWGLFRTNVEIVAPFTITRGTVPASFNAFRFLVSDLTGQLNITSTSQPY